MHTTSVDFTEMADSLLSLDDARTQLAATEPLAEHTFPTGSDLTFELEPGWAEVGDNDPCGATLTTPGGERFSLTKTALLEAGAHCGIPREYQKRLPSYLLGAQLNYWFSEGWVSGDKTREFKVLARGAHDGGDPLALAMCRGTIIPFSNLQLLDIATERIQARYGAETPIYVDYKFQHDLELTQMRLIVPGESRVIESTGLTQADDTWSAGIDIRNSLIGLKPPVVQGYLFRWWCTNGCTDELLSTGQFSRKGNHSLEDVWEWARESVDSVLGGLEGVFDGIQRLTELQVPGHEVTLVLQDLFIRYNIPVRERERIIANMAEAEGQHTLYSVMQAITQAANMDGLEPRAVEQLLRLGGHVAHAPSARCNPDHPCRRLLPEGYVIPENPSLN